MRRVGKPYKRDGKANWWLRWSDPVSKKRMCKSFHTKALADHYQKILYYQLNNDIFVGTIGVLLSEAIGFYLEKYKLLGLTDSAKTEATLTLKHFMTHVGDVSTKSIGQLHFDSFIIQRKKNVSAWTVNKDISNLRAFITWAGNKKQRYITPDIELFKLKTYKKAFKALTSNQIRGLFKDCPTPAWRCRLLLSLITGLRKSDIEDLMVCDIDLKTATIDSQSRKTNKSYIGRPLPSSAIPSLREYVDGLPGDQLNLFIDKNVRKTWDSFRGDVTRQDLRKTFSTLIQKIGSIGSAQNLLEHSDSRTTLEFYTDQELILRWKINQLPVKEWLD